MTEQHLTLLREARQKVNYVKHHLDEDKLKGELSQREVELLTSNLTAAMRGIGVAIAVLRDGPKRDKRQETH